MGKMKLPTAPLRASNNSLAVRMFNSIFFFRAVVYPGSKATPSPLLPSHPGLGDFDRPDRVLGKSHRSTKLR